MVNPMNDMQRYPGGAYFPLEHHLLRLALVSEVTPRTNYKYAMQAERAPQVSLILEGVCGV